MVFYYGVYVVAAFLLAIGIVALRLGWNSREINDKGRLRILSGSTLLVILGFFYLGMAHWTVLAGNGLVISEGNLAPCENVIANSTVTANTTLYEYRDSCAARTVPKIVERAYKVYTTTLLIDGLAILIFSMVYILMFIKRAVQW